MSIVVQVVQHLRPGGIETMALDLQHWKEEGEKTWVLSLEGAKQEALAAWPRLRDLGARLSFLNKRPGWQPGVVWHLYRKFKHYGVDTVHTHHIGPLIYAGIAARLAGVPHIVHTEHDAWHLRSRRRRFLQGLVLKLVRPRLVADAETVACGLRHMIPGAEPVVIRNGIDTAKFMPGDPASARARLNLPDEVPLVGCAGRLEEVKGQRFLIDALFRLKPEVHLALAGQGSCEAALREQVKELGLERRVHFVGHTDDMPTFYQALDVYCQPSSHEGLPLAPLEAQACGVPVVATAAGGTRETLCPYSGELVRIGDARALALALSKRLDNQPERSPRDFVVNTADVQKMAKAYACLRTANCELEAA